MRQVDVFDSLMVRWFRGLTRDFWAENAEKNTAAVQIAKIGRQG